MTNKDRKETDKTKTLTIIRGRGTASETRIETNIPLYWSQALQDWVTIPAD